MSALTSAASARSELLIFHDLENDFPICTRRGSVEDSSQRLSGAALFTDDSAEVFFVDPQLEHRTFIVSVLRDFYRIRTRYQVLSEEIQKRF